MLTEYPFTISIDFSSGVSTNRLQLEIQGSPIVTALDRIDTVGDICSVWFKDTLASGDESLLDGLISSHTGEPLPSDTIPVVLDTPAATTGVPGTAPAKGLGGFVPDPISNPYNPDVDEVVSHYVDVEGSLVTRGKVFTDEGSFRDDFTGTDLVLTLTGTVTLANGSRVVTGSGTLFTEELNRTQYIKLAADTIDDWMTITRVTSDTDLILDEPYGGAGGTGTAEVTRWPVHESGAPGTVSVGSSVVTISSGTGTDGETHIGRYGDFAPISSVWLGSISQRIANQEAHFGFRDDHLDPKHFAEVFFDGTDSTKVKFRTAWDGEVQSTTITLPSGSVSSSLLRYKIDLNIEYCALLVNGVSLARHNNHLPDMYADMELCAGIKNTGSVTNTDLTLDTVLFVDHNQVQIGSMFDAPIPIRISEDEHTLIGQLITTTTNQDQSIVSYTVPSGKVLYLIGYRIDNGGTNPGTIKIGRNPVGSEPSSPGTVGGNLFRVFELGSGGSSGEVDMGSNPRQLGIGGDQIVVAVTPKSKSASVWHAALDFVLR